MLRTRRKYTLQDLCRDSRNAKAVPIINTDPEKGEAGAIDLNAKDTNGDYIFSGDGEYVLTVEAEGYVAADFKITVTAPEIIEGDGTKWTTDSREGFDIVSDAPFKWFREAVLDGEKMEEPVVSEGSTHVTLSAELLGTLAAGEHTLLRQRYLQWRNLSQKRSRRMRLRRMKARRTEVLPSRLLPLHRAGPSRAQVLQRISRAIQETSQICCFGC